MTDWRSIETAPKEEPIRLLSRGYSEETEHYVVRHQPKEFIGKWWPEGTSWTDEYGDLDGEVCQLSVTGVWEIENSWLQPNEVTHWAPILPSTTTSGTER